MDSWIAQVYSDRIFTMLKLDVLQFIRNFIKCLLPGNLLPTISGLLNRCSKPIRIVVDILQRNRFGADVPFTDRVEFVAFDRFDLVVLNYDFQTAEGFTQV